MPAMFTHRICGDDIIHASDPSWTAIRAIDKSFEHYSIGTSGPDLFFFYQAYPWGNAKEAHRVHKYGHWMHEEQTKLLFETMVTECKRTKDPQQISYTAGVMIHWALDHIAHPYVFCRTGWGRSSDRTHCYFESQLDRGVINWKGINIHRFKTASIADFKEDTWYAIWQLYSDVLRKGWNTELGTDDVEQAVSDCKLIEKAISDPLGLRIKPYALAEKAIGKPGKVTSMVIPLKLDPAWNAMNEDHQLWHHPSTGEEHHESFRELFEQAVVCGTELMKAFSEYLDDKRSLEDLLALFTGNFHTGLDVPDDMKYFDLVPTRVPAGLI